MIELPPDPDDLLLLLITWLGFPTIVVAAVQLGVYVAAWLQFVRGGARVASKATAGVARSLRVLRLPSGIVLSVVHFSAQGLLVASVFSLFQMLDVLGIDSWEDAERSTFTGTWEQLWAAIANYRSADELSAAAAVIALGWVLTMNMCRVFRWQALACLTIAPAAAIFWLCAVLGGFFMFYSGMVWVFGEEYGVDGTAIPIAIAILAGGVQVGIVFTVADFPSRRLSGRSRGAMTPVQK